MSESAKIDKRKKRKLNLLDYAGTIHFHMNGSLHKMTGISISNQYPGPHKAHCAACNSTFKIDWGVILSIKQYEVAKSIKNWNDTSDYRLSEGYSLQRKASYIM